MTRPAVSLRLRLTVAVVGVLGLSLGLSSVVLYATFTGALWRQFDARLAEDARVIADVVEERTRGPWTLEAGALEQLEQARGLAYFEIWMDDGTVLARSRSLGAGSLPREAPAAQPRIARTTLPGGRPGRRLTASLVPRWDEDGPPRPSGRRVTVAVERDTREIDTTVAMLRLLLWCSGLSALGLAALAGLLATRGSLRPVARLAARVDAVDARRLGERLPVAGVPGELRGMVIKLNELLARLEESFVRERRFSADVSHELRTPLAGLRSILEVAASRERPAAEYRTAITDALAVVRQAGALVENLLLLARLDAHQVAVEREEVALAELVDECFRLHAGKAAARGLRCENRVPPGAVVLADRDKLRIVVTNLLDNAVEYTAAGGWIAVESDVGRGLVIAVADSGPPIPADALGRIFDRFVRLDPARAGNGEHCGIGLALVRALCEAASLSVTAENRADGAVVFRVTRAGARSHPATAGAPAP